MSMKHTPYYVLAICLGWILTANTDLSAQERSEATLLGRWSDPTIIGSFNHNNSYNEVWGLAVNGHEYGVIGSTQGTHFIDITDESNIHEAHFVPGGAQGGIIIHRDYHDHNGYLYGVSDQGDESTLQIIDIRQLPESIDVVYDSGEFSTNTHNIFIDTTANRLYLCKTSAIDLPRQGMRILDISNPTQPELIYTLNEIEGFGTVGTIHDAYVDDNIAYLNAGFQGMAIMDFTDVENPVVVASLFPEDYADSGYNHSGYLTEDRSHYYLADENHGRDIKALDVQNLPDIFVTDYIDAENDSPFSIPHNLIVHDGYLYGSYYYDGLQVWDLADPDHPVNVAYYPTSSAEIKDRFEGAWGVYPLLPSGRILVSDMQEGLFVLEMPASLTSTEEEVAFEGFTISPNPSSGHFTIQASDMEFVSDVEVYVYTADGSLVMRDKMSDNVSSLFLDQGFYMVALKSGNICSTQKLIVR